MTFRTAGRGVAGTCADSGGPDCHRRPRVRCKRYNLEVLARVYPGAGRRPVLRPARNPARAFEFAGARRSMVRRHPWVLPGSAVRANSRRQVPDRVSRVSVKMIRGAFGLEFLFINTRGRLDRQGAEYSVVRECARLIRCVEPYQKGRQATGCSAGPGRLRGGDRHRAGGGGRQDLPEIALLPLEDEGRRGPVLAQRVELHRALHAGQRHAAV